MNALGALAHGGLALDQPDNPACLLAIVPAGFDSPLLADDDHAREFALRGCAIERFAGFFHMVRPHNQNGGRP